MSYDTFPDAPACPGNLAEHLSMTPHTCNRQKPRRLSAVFRAMVAMFISFAVASIACAAVAAKTFDVPADDASRSLHRFSAQADQQILFSDRAVAGIKTNAVKGAFTPREALDRMLANTGLVANHNDGVGAIAVSKPKDLPKKAPGTAQPAAGANERDPQKKK
jgi:hypothetical protein